ncbi:MAG: ATP-binding protein, partial [Miltoncostaeaceae bacterium]
ADGDVVIDTEPAAPGPRSFASRPEIARALAGDVATGLRRSETLGGDLLFVAVPVAASGEVFGAVRVTYPGQEVAERARTYWLVLGGVALITLAAVGAIGLLVARWVARPLATLEQGADAVGRGDLTTRVPDAAGPPEVRALAARFNQMVSRLEELVGAQEAFVADASHQLRTPLTAMRLRIENLGASAGASGERDARAAVGEVDRLARLVDSLLALARADRRDAPLRHVDLSAALRERTDSWADLAAESGVRVEGAIAPGLRCLLADGVLEQVLDNLMDNAVRASPDGASVTVTADRREGRVELRVIDRGRGMSAEERGHAFDRFWRAPSAPAEAGSGLGLAIVARLVEAAGGTVVLEETPGGGLTGLVVLPIA